MVQQCDRALGVPPSLSARLGSAPASSSTSACSRWSPCAASTSALLKHVRSSSGVAGSEASTTRTPMAVGDPASSAAAPTPPASARRTRTPGRTCRMPRAAQRGIPPRRSGVLASTPRRSGRPPPPEAHAASGARTVLAWPRRCELARGFLLEYSCKRLELAQLLGQLGVVLTWASSPSAAALTRYPASASWHWSEKDVRLAQEMQVGPCIPVGIVRIQL